MKTDNFAFALLRRAFAHPDAIAFELAKSSVSYQRIADLIVHFAREMSRHGVDRRSTVGFVITSPLMAVVATSAVALLGARWLSAAGERSFPPSLTPTHLFSGLPGKTAGWISIDQGWFDSPPASERDLQAFPGFADIGDAWMLAKSSGTTGKPKFMPLSYAALWRRSMTPEIDAVGLKLCALFPALSYVAIKVNVANLVFGGTNVSLLPWDDMLARGVDRIMGSPDHLARLFGKAGAPRARISSCRVTGAQVTDRFVTTALRYFEEVQVLYGSTEVGGATIGRFTDDNPYDGSVGRPFETVEVEVIDEHSNPAPIGVEGTIRVRTAGGVPLYVGEPGLTAEYFRDGWFHPGDLGYFDAGGALHIGGRTDDVINFSGAKMNSADLDEVIQLHPDVADGYCFISEDERGYDSLAAIVQLRPGASRDRLGEIAGMAARKLGPLRVPKRVYVVDAVPRNENGKPLRRAAVELARALQPMELATPAN